MGPDLEMGWKPQQSDDAITPIPLYYSFLKHPISHYSSGVASGARVLGYAGDPLADSSTVICELSETADRRPLWATMGCGCTN